MIIQYPMMTLDHNDDNKAEEDAESQISSAILQFIIES